MYGYGYEYMDTYTYIHIYIYIYIRTPDGGGRGGFSDFKTELELLFGRVAFRIAWRKAAPNLTNRVRSSCRVNLPCAPKGGW